MASTTSIKLPSYQRLKELLHEAEEEDGWLEVFRAAEWTPGRRNGRPNRSKRCRLRWPQAKVGGLRRKARAVSAAVKRSLAELLKRLREAKPPCLGQLVASKSSSMPPSPALPRP
ncbi:hypothetical protein ZIOFF_036341 [Zingiber officinale]|uniref:Uncharacterized protein n=1 Tax=Zingiber officinale TaxID=94328 RepID=A0A8J5GQA9_ZINOF|nr:hypothetical protein ZIOFF_036341 [Zingiber officinale]